MFVTWALFIPVIRAPARSFRSQPVAGPRLGKDERSAAFSLELSPQPPHVDAQVLGLGLIAVAPYPAEQVGVGQQLAPVDRELAEQGELCGGQVHWLP